MGSGCGELAGHQGVGGAESTLTAIVARMAMDLKREVTWGR
jgi:hypothetical protein